MKNTALRPVAPRPASTALARPRPTAASALLLAVLLSAPIAALAVLQALL